MFAEIHIERGRIRSVLPADNATTILTESQRFEFPDCYVYPGFVDNHLHLYGFGSKLNLPSLYSANSEDECVALLSASQSRRSDWIVAMGWNQELWSPHKYPSKESLDKAFPDTPVVASRVDGHAIWVNSCALLAAGLDPNLYSGVLVDDEMKPIYSAIPLPNAQDVEKCLLMAANDLSSRGITEVHDMDIDPIVLDPLRSLAESGVLPIRIQSFVRAQGNEWQKAGLLPAGGEFLRLAGIKMFADGALGSRGARLWQEYADDDSTRGTLLLDAETIAERCRVAINGGWTCIATHAIGDEAASVVLDAYGIVRSWDDAQETILRMEHAQIVSGADVQRMKALKVMACVQPLHYVSDVEMALQRLGPDRLVDAYRWRSLIDAGVIVGAGSDAPIEPPDIIAGIDAFVRRKPSERISPQEALIAYTHNAHVTSGMEYRRGSIKPGFDADLVILDTNILDCELDAISSARVVSTFTAGKQRYML